LGFSDDDVRRVEGIDGVEAAMPSITFDAMAHLGNEQGVVRLGSLDVDDAQASTAVSAYEVSSKNDAYLNRPFLREGTWPSAPDECVASADDPSHLVGVGDTVTLLYGTSDLDDVVKSKELRVVGTVSSSNYPYTGSFGSTTLGSGMVDQYVYLAPDAFVDSMPYTEIYVKVEGAAAEASESDDYFEVLDKTKSRVEDQLAGLEGARLEDLRADAQSQLDEKRADYESEKADAEQKLADAKATLDDSKGQLDDSAAELADAKATLDESATTLADSKAQLDAGQAQYESGLAQYNAGLAQYNNGVSEYQQKTAAGQVQIAESERQLASSKAQLDAGEAQHAAGVGQLVAEVSDQLKDQGVEVSDLASAKAALEGAKTQISDGLAQIDVGLAQLDGGITQLQTGLEQAQAGLDQARVTAAELEGQVAQLGAASEQLAAQIAAAEAAGADEETLAQLRAQKDQVDAGLAQAQEGLGQAQAAQQELEVKIPELQAQLEQLQQQKAAAKPEAEAKKEDLQEQLASVQKGLDGIAALEASRAQLDAGWEQYNAGAAQLAAGKQQLEDQSRAGASQLADAKAQLDRSAAQLSAAKGELDSGRVQYNDGVAKYHDGLSQYQEGLAQYEDGRAKFLDGLSVYEKNRADADQKFADAEAQLADAQGEIDALEAPDIYVLDRSQSEGAATYLADTERMDHIAAVFPFIFFLVAALVALTTMTRMVDDDRVQIGTYKALGYGTATIASKYLAYAGIASVVGAVVGTLVLTQVLPQIVINSYAIIYAVPVHPVPMPILPSIALAAGGLGVGVTLLATWLAVVSSLRATPATLMLPRAPKAGKRILLERIRPLWSRMSFSWKVTFRNLFRYKRRLLMTVIGISGCTALLLVGFGLHDSIWDIINVQYGPISHYNTTVGLKDDASEEDVLRIRSYLESTGKASGLIRVQRSNMQASSGAGQKAYQVTAVVPQSADELKHAITFRDRRSGKPVDFKDDAVLITEKLSSLTGVGVGEQIVVFDQDDVGNAKGEGYSLTVTGVVENYVGNLVYVGRDAWDAAGKEAPTYNTLFGTVSGEEADRKVVGDALHEEPEVSTVIFSDETINTYSSALRVIDLIVVVLVVSAGMLAFIVLYNLTNINVEERVREIASLKVLGFTRGEVYAYIFREILLLAFLGDALGMFLGTWLATFTITAAEVDYVMFGRAIHAPSYAYSFLITMGFAVLIVILMRHKLDRVNMVESLKSVD
jgi:putative ABC transport system permease protein